MMIKKLSYIFLVVSIGLGVISFIVLPDNVITQIGLNGEVSHTMPKYVAILVPLILSGGGALYSLSQIEHEARKTLIISAVGILIYIINFIFNA